MIRAVATAIALLLAGTPILAQTRDQGAPTAPVREDIRAIHEALLLPELIAISVREGEEYGQDLAEQIFGPSPVPAEWTEVVAAIYDPAHLEERILGSLAEEIEPEDATAIRAFLEAEPGRSLFARELAARDAMADEEVEQAAREAAAVALAGEDDARVELLRRYAEANDLVETNVANAMNQNYAYMMGLMDGDALPGDMTEADILSDIWATEGQIRADTVEWLYAFLLQAYGDAPEADLEALIAFSETEAGRVLNRAVFQAFDQRYSEISRALGIAAARYLTTEAL
jgi:hypothetical protein